MMLRSKGVRDVVRSEDRDHTYHLRDWYLSLKRTCRENVIVRPNEMHGAREENEKQDYKISDGEYGCNSTTELRFPIIGRDSNDR
jgi:hypothetical protein